MACSRGQQTLGKPGQSTAMGGVTAPACSAGHDGYPTLGEQGGSARVPGRLRPRMACRLMQTRAAWPAKAVTRGRTLAWRGGEGWGAPSCRRCQRDAGGLQCRAQANEGPQEDGPLKTRRTNDWLARAKSDTVYSVDPMSTSLGGSTAARPANGGLQRLQRANVGA